MTIRTSTCSLLETVRVGRDEFVTGARRFHQLRTLVIQVSATVKLIVCDYYVVSAVFSERVSARRSGWPNSLQSPATEVSRRRRAYPRFTPNGTLSSIAFTGIRAGSVHQFTNRTRPVGPRLQWLVRPWSHAAPTESQRGD